MGVSEMTMMKSLNCVIVLAVPVIYIFSSLMAYHALITNKICASGRRCGMLCLVMVTFEIIFLK